MKNTWHFFFLDRLNFCSRRSTVLKTLPTRQWGKLDLYCTRRFTCMLLINTSLFPGNRTENSKQIDAVTVIFSLNNHLINNLNFSFTCRDLGHIAGGMSCDLLRHWSNDTDFAQLLQFVSMLPGGMRPALVRNTHFLTLKRCYAALIH